MSDPSKNVECREHGKRVAAFVCQHLVAGSEMGFHCGTSADDPDDPCPDAWCDRCEDAFQAEGGEWNDRSAAVAGIKLLCDRCYEAARERNWRQDANAFRRLIGGAMSYLEARQAELRDRFRISEYERYDWDQETGELVFSSQGPSMVLTDVKWAQ